jgi:hypothetical protein
MKYEDIIDLPHPTSAKHPRMSMHDRAAQFSPFAALTGHEEAIEETAQIHAETFEDNIGDNNAFSAEYYK